MPTNVYEKYLKHLDSIIVLFENAPLQGGLIPEGNALGILARAEAAIRKICEEDSPYVARMKILLAQVFTPEPLRAELMVGIVRALKSDLEDGYLSSLTEVVHADMFEDFLDQANHLLNEGYKDAAAVIAGSSLESHLTKLCVKHGIPLDSIAPDGNTKHRRADQLNQDLGKSVYGLLDQKQITTWLDVRNNAAHGQYSKYSAEHVSRFITWLKDFINKNPA